MSESPAVLKNDREMGAIIHLLFYPLFLVPLGNLLVPFILWIIYRDKESFIARQAAKSFNFAIVFVYIPYVLFFSIIGLLVLGGLMNAFDGQNFWLTQFMKAFPYGAKYVWGVIIGWLILGGLLPLLAAIRTYKGRNFRYFLSLPILRC